MNTLSAHNDILAATYDLKMSVLITDIEHGIKMQALRDLEDFSLKIMADYSSKLSALSKK